MIKLNHLQSSVTLPYNAAYEGQSEAIVTVVPGEKISVWVRFLTGQWHHIDLSILAEQIGYSKLRNPAYLASVKVGHHGLSIMWPEPDYFALPISWLLGQLPPHRRNQVRVLSSGSDDESWTRAISNLPASTGIQSPQVPRDPVTSAIQRVELSPHVCARLETRSRHVTSRGGALLGYKRNPDTVYVAHASRNTYWSPWHAENIEGWRQASELLSDGAVVLCGLWLHVSGWPDAKLFPSTEEIMQTVHHYMHDPLPDWSVLLAVKDVPDGSLTFQAYRRINNKWQLDRIEIKEIWS